MRILDCDTDDALHNVTIFLTADEARQMIGVLEDLVHDPARQHGHVNDLDYQREITIAVYTPTNLGQFDERSRRLIEASD